MSFDKMAEIIKKVAAGAARRAAGKHRKRVTIKIPRMGKDDKIPPQWIVRLHVRQLTGGNRKNPSGVRPSSPEADCRWNPPISKVCG